MREGRLRRMARPAPDARPDDLVTLRQAAALVGRTIDTLRDWRERYGLRDWRDTSTKGSLSLVSRDEVLTIAARVAALRPDASGAVDTIVVPMGAPSGRGGNRSPTHPDPLVPIGTPSTSAELAALPVLLSPLLADLSGERDRLRRERDDALAALAAARDRVRELETLVAHGRRSSLQAERDRLCSTLAPAPTTSPAPPSSTSSTAPGKQSPRKAKQGKRKR
jgi:hypothetical protein